MATRLERDYFTSALRREATLLPHSFDDCVHGTELNIETRPAISESCSATKLALKHASLRPAWGPVAELFVEAIHEALQTHPGRASAARVARAGWHRLLRCALTSEKLAPGGELGVHGVAAAARQFRRVRGRQFGRQHEADEGGSSSSNLCKSAGTSSPTDGASKDNARQLRRALPQSDGAAAIESR